MATKKPAAKKKTAPKKKAAVGTKGAAMGFPFGRGIQPLSGTQTSTLMVKFNPSPTSAGVIQPGESRNVVARLVANPQGGLFLILDEQ